MKISNSPPKGTADWMPEEFRIRKYIFDVWRKVCLEFGYEEYLTPIVESAEVYRAKSGEDVGGIELMTFFDRGGRELAIRPEMTPSVTRMVTKFYNDVSKPIRLFSIANFMRNEKPQKGRNREFWQLNFDVFGVKSMNADIEILQMALEIMNSLGAKPDMYEVLVNSRELIDAILVSIKVPEDKKSIAVRILDKYRKLSDEDLGNRLIEEAGANSSEFELLFGLLSGDVDKKDEFMTKFLGDSQALKDLNRMINQLNKLGYKNVVYTPSLIRGFDYYDGTVFEVFDKHPENRRALFGGGRYNGLAGIFGSQSFPAVGCAPGDERLRIFLENWNLVPENLKADVIYIPMLGENIEFPINQIAKKYRSQGKVVEVGLEVQKLGKALEYANKKGIKEVVILGVEEIIGEVYKVKDMVSGEERVEKM